MMMHKPRTRRGMTVFEMLMGILACGFVLIALGWLFGVGSTAQKVVYDENAQSNDAAGPLNTMGDHLRSAQNCISANGCTGGIQGSVLSAASANDITYYADGTTATGSPVRYHLVASGSNFNLVRTVGAANTTVLYNIRTLTFTYYKITTLAQGSATQVEYNSPSVTTTANANAPTTAELPNLAAIRITATTVSEVGTVQYSTFVRLRNSPYRVNLMGN